MKKSSIKAFTLIELLVVVAIIGILAAVGVVSFGGFTGSAKINSTKANHAQAARLIQAELKKCEIQGENLSLKSTASNTTVNSVVCSKSFTSTEAMIIAIVNHLNNENFKNPYNYKLEAFTKSGSTIGQTVVTSDGATIALTTRYKDSNDGTIKILETFIKDNRFN
jgi:type IV pilus assembly protein PilA